MSLIYYKNEKRTLNCVLIRFLRAAFSEEITRLENELKSLIHEAGVKVNLEVEKVKTMYKDKLREANIEIESLRTVRPIYYFVTTCLTDFNKII